MLANRFRAAAIATTGAVALLVTAACGGAGSSTPAAPANTAESTAAGSSAAGGGELTLLYGSSGPAETAAIDAASAAFTAATGTKVTATPAQDLPQQLAQGFSSGQSSDVFYVGADQFANYAKAGNLLPYADSLPGAADFYPALKDQFTYDGKFYCAPKDMSTLALFINTDMWTAAGLTDADIPTTWDQLATVAKKLTTPTVAGLSVSPERDRLNAFLVQNGSFLVSEDGKTVTANDPKNVEALTYVQGLWKDGTLKTPKDLGAGWAGEAFGKGSAAMTIEGNWLLGSLSKDYPDVKYTVAELPAGPSGDKGTLVFTNCWGIAATTAHPDQAKAFVEAMTTKDQQLTFAKDFGVIPSIQSAEADYLTQFPDNQPFVNGVKYARGVVGAPGITDVLTDFNAQLEGLNNTDPKTILDSVQENLTAEMGS
jgi:multiple sugar transport system substrate-binding protein